MLKRLNGVMEETERLKIEVLEVKGTVPKMKNTCNSILNVAEKELNELEDIYMLFQMKHIHTN